MNSGVGSEQRAALSDVADQELTMDELVSEDAIALQELVDDAGMRRPGDKPILDQS